jgi:hypothetical protein
MYFYFMGKRVRLFELIRADIKVTVDAFFDENGNLLVDGYDIGKTVESAWGDSDYEYSITVPKENLDALCLALELKTNGHEEILEKMKEKFSGNSGFSAFGDFLSEKGIKYDSSSWT